MKKRCTRCGNTKTLKAFGKNPTSRDGRKSWCKVCYSTYNAAKLKECRQKNPSYCRRKNLAKNYDMTLVEYDILFESQNGVCAICGVAETSTWCGVLRHLCVDHDHTTSKVRGLLCSKCNQAIGLFDEAPERLVAAAKYLIERTA